MTSQSIPLPKTPRGPPPVLTLQDYTFELSAATSMSQFSDYVFAHIAITFDLDLDLVKSIFDARRGAFLRHKQKLMLPPKIFPETAVGLGWLSDRRKWWVEHQFMIGESEKENVFHINGLTYKVKRNGRAPSCGHSRHAVVADFVCSIVPEKKGVMLKNPIFQAYGKGTIKQLQVKSYLLKDDDFGY